MRALWFVYAFLLFSGEGLAHAFPHVAQKGETLAALAERYYGRIQFERVLARANFLDGSSSAGLTPGMILEVPALTYRQVRQDETWQTLALELLGDERRHILLAQVNGHKPWVEPELGQLIAIPYNLTWVATGQESLATLAYRFLGSTKHAYRLTTYNQLGDRKLKRGDLLLLPLSDLPLTAEGLAAAKAAATKLIEQTHGDQFEEQKRSHHQTKELSQEVQSGRYIPAVARGTQLLSSGNLTQSGRGKVHFLLLQAYVALGAQGLARTSCRAFRSLRPQAKLDPFMVSPKIIKICGPQSSNKINTPAHPAQIFKK